MADNTNKPNSPATPNTGTGGSTPPDTKPADTAKPSDATSDEQKQAETVDKNSVTPPGAGSPSGDAEKPKSISQDVLNLPLKEDEVATMDQRYRVAVGTCGGFYMGDVVEGQTLEDSFGGEKNVERLLAIGALEVHNPERFEVKLVDPAVQLPADGEEFMTDQSGKTIIGEDGKPLIKPKATDGA